MSIRSSILGNYHSSNFNLWDLPQSDTSYNELEFCLLQTLCRSIVLLIILFDFFHFILFSETTVYSIKCFFIQLEISWKNIGSYIYIWTYLYATVVAATFSPALFAVNVKELFVELEEAFCGLHGGVFMGALRYCDDLLFFALTRYAMQLMHLSEIRCQELSSVLRLL